MTTAEIAKKAQAQAEGGLDIHTIRTDAEVRLGRKLEPAERKAVDAGWAAAAPARAARRRDAYVPMA